MPGWSWEGEGAPVCQAGAGRERGHQFARLELGGRGKLQFARLELGRERGLQFARLELGGRGKLQFARLELEGRWVTYFNNPKPAFLV